MQDGVARRPTQAGGDRRLALGQGTQQQPQSRASLKQGWLWLVSPFQSRPQGFGQSSHMVV